MKQTERYLNSIAALTKDLIGYSHTEDQGWGITVVTPRLTYRLPAEVLNKWQKRPAVIARDIPRKQIDISDIEGDARLMLSRVWNSSQGISIFTRSIELQVRQRGEESGLWWIYQMYLWKREPKGVIQAETSHYLDDVHDRAPVFGMVMSQEPPLNQLKAFEFFLQYAAKTNPMKTLDKYNLS